MASPFEVMDTRGWPSEARFMEQLTPARGRRFGRARAPGRKLGNQPTTPKGRAGQARFVANR